MTTPTARHDFDVPLELQFLCIGSTGVPNGWNPGEYTRELADPEPLFLVARDRAQPATLRAGAISMLADHAIACDSRIGELLIFLAEETDSAIRWAMHSLRPCQID